MARLVAMSTLLTSLRALLGRNLTNPALGSGDDPILMQLLSDKQKWLASEYDWPFLEDRFDISVPPQSRYLSFPTLDDEGDSTAMNMERPYIVEVFWANKWAPLTHGIGSEQFNYLNSDQAGQFQDPVQNWRWSQEGKFEIWPINATAVTIRFTGQRALDTLAALSDTADLDDQLLVLAVAADMLRRSNQADADLREQQFQRRLIQIRASYPGWKSLVFGENDLESAQTPRLVGIRVGVAGN